MYFGGLYCKQSDTDLTAPLGLGLLKPLRSSPIRAHSVCFHDKSGLTKAHQPISLELLILPTSNLSWQMLYAGSSADVFCKFVNKQL